MRSDAEARQGQLCEVVLSCIESEGQSFDGQVWAIRPLEDWAALVGVSTRTIIRMIKRPPIRSTRTRVEGKVATLLRVGEASPPTHREIAQQMARVWRSKVKRQVGSDAFGCLVGLAQEWPDGHQVSVFAMMLDDWANFMVGVGMEIAFQTEVEGVAGLTKMHFKYPSIATLRRFHHVAFETWKMSLQEAGKWPPEGWSG